MEKKSKNIENKKSSKISGKKKKISLKEKFEKFNGTYENDFSWDEPVGKEIW